MITLQNPRWTKAAHCCIAEAVQIWRMAASFKKALGGVLNSHPVGAPAKEIAKEVSGGATDMTVNKL